MSQRVFFIECSVPFWMDVAESLQKRQGWQPVYWTGYYTFEDEVKKRFPDICFHANYDAVKGIPAGPHASRQLPPLDENLLGDAANTERVALRMMDRLDPDESMTFTDRVRLFHRHLRYWLGILDYYKPIAVILPNSPHLVYDYVLYELCKRKDIPTLLFNETSVNGLIYPVTSFENGSAVLVNAYKKLLSQSKGEPVLSEWTEQYLKKVQGNYSEGLPSYLKPFYQKDETVSLKEPVNKEVEVSRPPPTQSRKVNVFQWLNPINVFRQLWAHKYLVNPYRIVRKLRIWRQAEKQIPLELEKFFSTLKEHGLYNPIVMADAIHCTDVIYRGMLRTLGHLPHFKEPAPLSYLVQSGKVPEKAGYTGLEYWVFRLMAAKKKIGLREHYEKLAKPVDWQQPFIYHALHYQPEKSTCPEGNIFANQFLIIDLLSKCAPQGWKICVKEHPFQFELAGSGELTRSVQFYDDVMTLPNVQFVPQAYSPFDLIDQAQAVATVTGTTGWEAVVRGKPVLIFGHAWYRGCEGVFYTPTEKECRAALQQISLGYKPDARLVRVFLNALEEVSFRGWTIPELADWAGGISPQANVEAFVQVLEKSIPHKRAA